MGFFHDLGCAVFGCSSDTPPVANVVNNFTSRLNVSCTPTVNASQSTTCTLMNKHCKNMNVQCGNISQMSTSCDFAGLTAAAIAALKGQSQQALTKGLSLPSNASYIDIQNAVQDEISTNCSAGAIANSEVLANFLCTNSDDTILQAMSQFDGSSACAVAAVAGIVKRGANNSANILFIVGFVIVMLLYIAFLVLVVVKIRASGKSR